MKRKLFVIFTIFSLFSAQNVFADVNQLNLEIIYDYGDWDVLTPFLLETTNTTHRVIAQVNATNISEEDPLDSLQYLHFIFDFANYSEPSGGSDINIVYFSMKLEFPDGKYIWLYYTWEVIWELLGTQFKGNVTLYDGETKVREDLDYGLDDTRAPEFYFWRSKSNQPIMQIKTGDWVRREYFSVFSDWDLKNIWYQFMTQTDEEMSFTVRFDDFGFLSGTNDGISDPVSNENWGIFEPVRQILLFVLKVFVGLIDLILPQSLEDAFDHFLETIGNYIPPLLAVMVWLGSNFVDFLIIINLFLLMNGVWKASEGELIEVVTPFWTFYSTLGGFVFRIIGFIMSVIKAMIGALPF